jgi:hypothetical protein
MSPAVDTLEKLSFLIQLFIEDDAIAPISFSSVESLVGAADKIFDERYRDRTRSFRSSRLRALESPRRRTVHWRQLGEDG